MYFSLKRRVSRVWERDMTEVIQVEKIGRGKTLCMYGSGEHLGVAGVDNAGKSAQDFKRWRRFQTGPVTPWGRDSGYGMNCVIIK